MMSARARRLRDLPAARIVASLAGACERWADADFPPRVRATRAVMERMGYSEPVVDYALDRLFEPVTVPALRAVIDNELGSLSALDGFAARPHRPDAYARGVDSVTIVSSDSTIGVALWPAIFALCAKSAVTVKDRGDDLIAAFRETLAEEDPAFADAFAAERWEHHDHALARMRLSSADVVVAFGRDPSLQAIRERCRGNVRFFGYGHRTSAGYVEREGLRNVADALEIARGCARDALLYDGEGCLSLHAIFVERGGAVSAEDFAALLDRAAGEAEIEFPPAREPSRSARGLDEFRAAQGAAEIRRYRLSVSTEHDRPPPLEPRTLALFPVDDPRDAERYLQQHALPIEAFALAAPERARPDVMHLALASGAARIAALGFLQSPVLESNHGGDGRITPFVRWIVRDR